MSAFIWNHVWLIWVEIETVIGQKPLWAESSPPRSLEGTKKPGLLRVNSLILVSLGNIPQQGSADENEVNGWGIREGEVFFCNDNVDNR